MLPEHLAFLDMLLAYGVPEEQALQFLVQSGLVPAAPAAAPVTAAVEPVVPGAGPPPQAAAAPEPAATPQAPAATAAPAAAPAPTPPAAPQPQQRPNGPGPGYQWPISGGARGIANGLVQRGMQGAQAPKPKFYTGAPRPAMPPRPETTGPTRRVMPPSMFGPKGGW